ncbi:hypothetical protein BN131_3061 [Cronobacter malonaticus 681]|nr:hypothetical protein BN131_3061 [Cronobacter malonaticus 681]
MAWLAVLRIKHVEIGVCDGVAFIRRQAIFRGNLADHSGDRRVIRGRHPAHNNVYRRLNIHHLL